MKIVDFVKNALFEVEYVEVPEGQEQNKPDKKDKKKEKADKPIAKKIVLPKPHKKEEKPEEKVVENGHDIEENNHNIEVDVEKELPKEDVTPIITDENEIKKGFKIMDDNDFKVDDYPNDVSVDQPVIDVIEPTPEVVETPTPVVDDRVIYRQEVREHTPYGIDESNKNLVHDYGGKPYEKKEERTGFKPSPIISPIYGVLDKNYKKEDVKEKRNVHISSYSRENIDVDDVRKKAFGDNSITPKSERVKEEPVVLEEEEDDSNLLVDLSKDESKPSIKEVTMGDAMEYFDDLGLEYNVDYKDASKEKNVMRRSKDNYDDKPELFAIDDNVKEVKEEKVVEKEPVSNNSTIDVENDDNLFDLIDSMYDEK